MKNIRAARAFEGLWWLNLKLNTNTHKINDFKLSKEGIELQSCKILQQQTSKAEKYNFDV